jgi:hypothetical protein
VIGYDSGGGIIEHNYANSAMKVQNGNGNVAQINELNGKAGMGKTLAELKTESFYTTQSNWSDDVWNFDEVWDICEGKTFPWLRWQNIDCDNLSIINNTIEVQVKVHPNPTRGELTIDNGELTIDNVEIYDMMGRTVYSSTRPLVHPSTINISHLATDNYFLRLQTEKGKIKKKVIRE